MWLWQLHLIRKQDTEAMWLSSGSILTFCILLLHCILQNVKHIYKLSYILQWCGSIIIVLLLLCFRIQEGSCVQYSWQTFWNYEWIFHGPMDWDPARDAGGSGYHSYYHTALIRLLPLKCQCEVIWDFVDVSWKGKLRNRNREWQSDCLTNKCWYIF